MPRAIADWGRKASFWLRDNAALITVICAILMVLLVALGTFPAFFGGGSSDGATEIPAGAAEPLTAIGQAREAGGIWHPKIELPDDGGRVDLGVRVHNSGSTAIPNVAVRIPVPEPVDVVPGSCRLGIDAVAVQACRGAVAGEGTVVGELPAESWLHIVVTGEVAPSVPGGTLATVASVGSDQTEELSTEVEIVVAPNADEKAVGALLREASEVKVLEGSPEAAADSKRVLTERWPGLGLASDREFGEMSEGRPVGLLRLYYDRRFDGKLVEIRAQVLSPPLVLPAARGAVAQSMEIGSSDGGAKGWCFTVRPAGALLRQGDWVEVKALPIGWGGLESRRRPVPVTLLACPAMRLLRHGSAGLLDAPRDSSASPWSMVSVAAAVTGGLIALPEYLR